MNTAGSYLTAKEAAKILKLSLGMTYRLSRQGRIRSYKPGGKVLYFLQEDCENYIKNGERHDYSKL